MKYFTREIERVEIGRRAGAPIVARVERRAVDLSVGGRDGGGELRLEWLRPVAIEAGGGGGPRELSLAVSPDPWSRALLGMLILWVLSIALTTAAGCLRARSRR